MKRVVGVVVWLVVLVGTMLWPAVAYNWSTRVRGVRRDHDPQLRRRLHRRRRRRPARRRDAHHRLPGSGKHGIFRFFDEADPSQTNARRVPHDISVTRDGSPEPFEILDEENGRFTNVKIGSADVFIDPGDHTYVIDYTIDGVLEAGTRARRRSSTGT